MLLKICFYINHSITIHYIVFLGRSILGSKAPFLYILLIMMLLGYLFRKKSYPELICIYSIAIIAFSSAIANQYLTICSVAIALNYKNIFFGYIFSLVHYFYLIMLMG